MTTIGMHAGTSTMIDLRSDYLATPSIAMREEYFRVSGNPQSYGLREDPYQKELELALARLVGKEDALIFPTCTMANLAAIIAQTQPGDIALCTERAHIFNNEGAGAAAYGGVQLQLAGGLVAEAPVEEWVNAAAVSHGEAKSKVTLCSLENTHNRLGGAVLSSEYCRRWASALRGIGSGLSLHLDGSRILHAASVIGCEPEELAVPFDTISISLNKGLGAPVASALMGTREVIAKANRIRQRLGGGMRPTGAAAAATLVALRERGVLLHDVTNAKQFGLYANALSDKGLEVEPVTSNLVFLALDPGMSSDLVAERCKARGLLLSTPNRSRLRAAFHRGVGAADVANAAAILQGVICDLKTELAA